MQRLVKDRLLEYFRSYHTRTLTLVKPVQALRGTATRSLGYRGYL